LSVEEEIGPKRVGHHQRIIPPEVSLQVISNQPDPFIKPQALKVTNRFAPDDVIPTAQQSLTQPSLKSAAGTG
jgi:hypothetical protein